MITNKLILFKACVCFSFLLLSNLAFSQQTNQPYNILFILSDDQSVPDLSCYGNLNLKTPNIDRIAKEGILFNRMYVTSPQCSPSRASLMSGRSAVDIRMTRFVAPLAKDIITFPEVLKQNNYYVGLVGRTYHLDGPGSNISDESKKVFEEYHLETFKQRLDYQQTCEDPLVFQQFTTFLSKVPKGKPFFIQTNFSNPHRPWTAPSQYNPDPSKIKVPAGMPDTKLLREDLATYYGEIMQLDEYVGNILDELDKRGLSNNTMVVFMGDNGAAVLRGKGTLYEAGVNVPFAVKWPNKVKNKGILSSALLSGEDLGPSFIALAGGEIPKEMTGKSFLSILEGSEKPIHDYVFSERGVHGYDLPTSTGPFDLGRTAVGKRYKLVYNALWQLPYSPVDFRGNTFYKELAQMSKNNQLEEPYNRLFFRPQRPMFELFDLEKDPQEITNLYNDVNYAKERQDLLVQLNKWMILNQDFLPLPIIIANGKGK